MLPKEYLTLEEIRDLELEKVFGYYENLYAPQFQKEKEEDQEDYFEGMENSYENYF